MLSILDPVFIDSTTQVTDNIPAPGLGAWNSGTAYVVGDIVVRGKRTYQAIANSTGQDPEDANSTFWAWIGYGPQHAPFDTQIGVDQPKATDTATTYIQPMEFTIRVDGTGIDTVAIGGIKADEILFEYLPGDDPVDPAPAGTGPVGAQTVTASEMIFTGFSLPESSFLKITFSRTVAAPYNPSNAVEVSNIVWGGNAGL